MKKFLYKLLLLLFLILTLTTTSFADEIEDETIDITAEIQASADTKEIRKCQFSFLCCNGPKFQYDFIWQK